MRQTFQELKKLPVETESGFYLGKVVDLVLDIETESVIQLVVKQGVFLREEVLISRAQIVAITVEKIIVEDTVRPIEDDGGKALSVDTEPVAMSEVE